MGKPKIKTADLDAAFKGSYYTIVGAGGDLTQWTEGYEKWLSEEDVGKPKVWFQTTGAAVNHFATQRAGGGILGHRDAFKDDATILLFPLDGLNPGKLPIFKVTHGDRWFDDVIQSMRVAAPVA